MGYFKLFSANLYLTKEAIAGMNLLHTSTSMHRWYVAKRNIAA